MLDKLASFAVVFLAEGDDGGTSWFTWLLIIIIAILVLVFLWRWFTRPQSTGSVPTQPATPPVRLAEPVIPAPAAPAQPDDLAMLEGIGPKIASVLQAAGISTFSQLASADLNRITQVLQDAGLRLADPATWPEQARLAAEGKWEELKTLTDNLKGGRRTT
jgi:predicted flap endonuclease-1-like 5' DNA nuclease